MSWYPLGRPVGTTIYPGMQIVSVGIWRVLNEVLGISMTLNDVCCYVPAWFGAIATVFLGLVTWECTDSPNAAVVASGIMAVVPAHIMRSVGGGYDNESVAMTAMLMTFYLWNRCLRGPHRKLFAVLAAAAYTFMVAAWGGYVFVINLIGIHASILVLLGHFNDDLYWSYTIFFALGTYGATTVPVVGWAPLKSLEQLGPCAAFLVYQVLQLCEMERKKLKVSFNSGTAWKIRARNFGIAAVAGAMVVAALFPTGYFGPLSSRVRGLFVKHTRTGEVDHRSRYFSGL
jgi:dolichyl-diphosphooligosaccharide--protein glycosyltransferase